MLAGCGDHGDDVSGVCRVRQKPKMEIVLTKSAEFDAIVAEDNEPNGADSADYNGVISYSLFPQYNLYIARLFVTGLSGHQAICSPDRLLSCKGSCTSPRCTLLELDPIHMI